MREAILRYPLYKIESGNELETPVFEIGIKRAVDLLPTCDVCLEAFPFLIGATISYRRKLDTISASIGIIDFLFRSLDSETELPMNAGDGIQIIFLKENLIAFNACFRTDSGVDKRGAGEIQTTLDYSLIDLHSLAIKSVEVELKRALVNLCTSVWVVMSSFERSTPENEELKDRLVMMKQYLVEAEQLLAKEKI